jgi:transglutaminase-like putative cysteine protease
MHEFFLEYVIENIYDPPVRKANFQLLVIPDSNPQQDVQDLKLYSPENPEPHLSKNIFGFETINYYIGKPFSEFRFKLNARILKPEFNSFYISHLHPDDEFNLINSIEFRIDNNLFLSSTPLTKLPSVVHYSFPEYKSGMQVFDFLMKLNTFIFDLLEYSPESTDINTPIEDVLVLRKGVCQDYSHLFISVCRDNMIPARYVSGYLNQGAGSIGTSQLHAWVEAMIPELGWVGFDSTNNLLADHNYIKIAHGTDYRDCSPIIGMLESSGAQKSIHSVTVTNQ